MGTSFAISTVIFQFSWLSAALDPEQPAFGTPDAKRVIQVAGTDDERE
jgi:hypothetical protein